MGIPLRQNRADTVGHSDRIWAENQPCLRAHVLLLRATTARLPYPEFDLIHTLYTVERYVEPSG
jgi:hypothetical protein